MKFIQRVDYIMEVEDDILLEYVEYCDQREEQYSASHFIDWLDSHYCLGDLVGEEIPSTQLETDYLIDEINYILNNDRERIS